jgi:two-component system, NarL family, sensor histidine kinase UhpB
MRNIPNKTRALTASLRPIDLKTSLVIRIAVVAISCLVMVTAAVLWDSDREARSRAKTTADLVARHLNWQLMRINAGFDASNRFPDWSALLSNNPVRGQCVRLESEKGALVRSDCVGSLAATEQAPPWFSAVWSHLSSQPPQRASISYKGKDYGTVIVSSDPKTVASLAWDDVKNLIILTALTILALSVLVYVAISRALAPTKEMIAGLNRLGDGDFSHRLPGFKLAELQRISEVVNALAEQVETTLAQRAELSRRLINAQEDERRHLARELHDELGQSLTAMAALSASIEKSANTTFPELSEEARTLSEIALKTMQSMRGTLAHLRPAELDKIGLRESLRHLVNVWSAGHNRQTRFELCLPDEVPQLSDTAATHVFRIAQEGLTNAAKHANAQTVRLSMEPVMLPRTKDQTGEGLRLTIEDDGLGRRLNGKSETNGMGLLNMQERVAALGGSISFDDRPGSGLTISVVVPVSSKPDNRSETGHD